MGVDCYCHWLCNPYRVAVGLLCGLYTRYIISIICCDIILTFKTENAKLVDADYVGLVRVAQARLAATLTNPTRTLCPTFYEINCVAVCRFSSFRYICYVLIVL